MSTLYFKNPENNSWVEFPTAEKLTRFDVEINPDKDVPKNKTIQVGNWNLIFENFISNSSGSLWGIYAISGRYSDSKIYIDSFYLKDYETYPWYDINVAIQLPSNDEATLVTINRVDGKPIEIERGAVRSAGDSTNLCIFYGRTGRDLDISISDAVGFQRYEPRYSASYGNIVECTIENKFINDSNTLSNRALINYCYITSSTGVQIKE